MIHFTIGAGEEDSMLIVVENPDAMRSSCPNMGGSTNFIEYW